MIEIIKKSQQAYGEFNKGEIIENKPIGFPLEGGKLKPYSNIFYWAHAKASVDSVIGLHPHKGFEIISVVLKGGIKHYDTLIKKWIDLKKGDVQIIQSGSGISHSEAINKNSSIFQIWLDPNLEKTLYQTATYKDYSQEDFPTIGNKRVLIGEESPLKVKTEGVEMFELNLKETFTMKLNKENYYSIYVLSGSPTINNNSVEQDDFIRIKHEQVLVINSKVETKLFCIVSPANVSYPTYAE
jgi:redox-sensitive bicupin YhaK (pirin superfamily)